MIADVQKNIADPEEIPKPATDIDVTQLELSAQEGFVFSRIDGQTPVKSLSTLTGFSEADIASALQRHKTLGAVVSGDTKKPADKPKAASATPSSGSSPGADPYRGFVFTPADINEENDLNLEQRKKILFHEAKLDAWNHFELLGLGRGSNAADVRKAYFKASKQFHPDAFFRKSLGSYTRRIDKIFKAMKVSYDLLSNDETRGAYEATIVWALSADEEQQIVAKVKRDKREGQRAVLAKTRRLKRNPMLQRLKRAAELYKLGLVALRAEKWIEAANHLRIAITYDPQKKAYHQAYSEAAGMANYIRSQNILRSMDSMLEEQDPERLGNLVSDLLMLAEENAEIMAQGSEILLRSGSVRRAFELGQKAVAAQDSFRPGLQALAHAAEAAQKWHVALRTVQKLLALDPGNSSYKDWSKRLKRHT